MCLNPHYIKNVNHFNRNVGLNVLNSNTYYIAVPCGVCSSCLALKQSYIIQRCQLESIDNDLWFCTLTYNNESLPVTSVNGRKIRYAWLKDLQNWLKMLRKYDVFKGSFRYLAVSEFGGKGHRPHWHVIFSTPKNPKSNYYDILDKERYLHDELLKYWRRNLGSTRKPIWQNLLTYVVRGSKRTYDFHYVNPSFSRTGEDDVGFYVTKYVLKFDDYVKRLKSGLYFNLSSEKFKEIWSLVKPKFLLSKGFGDIHNEKAINYVKHCIQTSLKDDKNIYPLFINPVTGQEFPLAPYLRRKFLSVEDEYEFYERKGANNYLDYEDLTVTEYQQKVQKFDRVRKVIASRNNLDNIHDEKDISFSHYESPTIEVRLLFTDDFFISESDFYDDLPPDEIQKKYIVPFEELLNYESI